jgi:hypothetical protein
VLRISIFLPGDTRFLPDFSHARFRTNDIFSGHSGPFYGFALANWKVTYEGTAGAGNIHVAIGREVGRYASSQHITIAFLPKVTLYADGEYLINHKMGRKWSVFLTSFLTSFIELHTGKKPEIQMDNEEILLRFK